MENTIAEYMEKINAYIKYLKEYGNHYCNAFEVLNVQENTLTELIAWLFDIKSNNDKPIKEIKETFFKKFMELLCKKNDNDKFFNNIISDIKVKTQNTNEKGIPDILLNSEKGEFICVIENKICAKLNICNGKTQIENYKEIKEYQKYNNKFFVFICGNKDSYPNKKVIEHCKPKKKYENGKYANEKIETLLNDNGFIILEHCDIIKILSEIFKEKCHDKFQNGILKPTTNEEMKSVVKLFLNNKEASDKIIHYLQNQKLEYFIYENLKKEGFKSSGSKTIPLREILKKEEDAKKIINILCQYIEYCELHNGKVDYFQAYTKLLDGEPVWNICERIYNNKEKWLELTNKSKDIEELKNILNNIELSKKRKNQ